MALLQVTLFACILFLGRKDKTTVGKGIDSGDIWVSKGPNQTFSHFVQHKKHFLDVKRIRSFLVGFVTECALRCLHHDSCISFNIEDNTANHKEVMCELLPKDLYQISHKLQRSETFHHWSIMVSGPRHVSCAFK